MLAALALAGCPEPEREPPRPVLRVSAEGEVLEGELVDGELAAGAEADAGAIVVAFKGVPFAAPPVGPLRWRPPAPATPRKGVQPAREHGPRCPQADTSVRNARDLARDFGTAPALVPELAATSEDCLYLNVWTSSTRRRSAPSSVQTSTRMEPASAARSMRAASSADTFATSPPTGSTGWAEAAPPMTGSSEATIASSAMTQVGTLRSRVFLTGLAAVDMFLPRTLFP